MTIPTPRTESLPVFLSAQLEGCMRKGAGGSEMGREEQGELLSHLTVVVKLQPELKTTIHSADTKDKKEG